MLSNRLLNLVLLPSVYCLLFSLTSCAGLGVAANAFPHTVKARYSGLVDQKVGVMVWADRGISIDWGTIGLDLANSIEDKLKSAKTKETKGITFPYMPASFVRYQRDHPNIETMPVTDFASKLGVSRLIYIEIHRFGTRSASELELFRGEAQATLQIIEINGDTATVAFTEDNVIATFPKGAPADGEPGIGDSATYSGTVDRLGKEIVGHLTTHEEEDDERR